MTCREVSDFLMDYTAGTLAADVRARFEVHLRGCRECREYLALYLRTIELGRRAFDAAVDAVPTAIPEDLVRAILASRSPDT